MKATFRVGLISDTHGLLRPEAVEAMCGSDFIVHAGDVGDPTILEHLRASPRSRPSAATSIVAPGPECLPETAVLQAGEALIYVLHDIADLDLDPARQGSTPSSTGTPTAPLKKVVAGVSCSSIQGVSVPGGSPCPFLRESYSFRVAR